MGELHINIWRQNLEEGMDITFVQDGEANGKPTYELAFRTKSGAVISFWTCSPSHLRNLLLTALDTISREVKK